MTTDFDHKSFLANVGESAGVYQMLDEEEVLYVGKAKNLKNRLSSYFRTTRLPTKTLAMMARVNDITVTVTHTEDEALLLESNLIKKLKPRYNVLLRDSKSYPFIQLETDHEYPRLGLYRGDRKEAGKYFGPYASGHAVRETLAMVQKVLPIRQCDDSFFRNRSRPCLQYQIKRCSGPCVGLISKKEYARDVRQSVMFLQGRDQTLNRQLIRKMEKASKALDFETAGLFRDRINALRRVQAHQAINAESGEADIMALVEEHGKYSVDVTFMRGGRHSGSNGYHPSVALDMTHAEVMETFISQFYLGRKAPRELLVDPMPTNSALVAAVLSEQAGHKVRIANRIRGPRLEWLKMSRANAVDRLRRHLVSAVTLEKRFEALEEALSMDEAIARIECFDISHTMGEATVASCVVFDTNGPVKSDYRRYNIEGITGGDDYAAMRQVLTRRYSKLKEGEGKIPELLLIDGGKGQLSQAIEVIDELQLHGVTLVGVAKGEARRPGFERLFLRGRRQPIILGDASSALHLVQQVRDEAHRFAITGHRQRRGKARTQSTLQEIEGIGDKRRQSLLKHFGGIQGVKGAGIKDLASVPGISMNTAKRIYGYFREE